MKKTLAILLIFSISCLNPNSGIQIHAVAAGPPSAAQDYWEVQFSPEQLENLVAPIALYPDPLLAQVLLAATFPDQVDAAAREIRAYGRGYNIDYAPWDVSVKAVSHYPTVLSMMADKLDWTTALGQAYVSQSTDVMDAVQRLRHQARDAGNLVTTAQWQVVDTSGYLYIYPAQPRYIYVPVYDPAVVYVHRPAWYTTAIISFGVGLLIGAWLNHDCDWDHHRVYYHGWGRGYAYGPPPVWVGRSRPYVRVTNVYVNNTYNNVVVNRTVVNRNVNYGALNRYNSIHRDVDYSRVRHERGAAVGERRQPPGPTEQQRDNKIIRRNIDPNDPRINANRGRGQLPQTQPEARTVPAPEAGRDARERRVRPGEERKQPQVTPPAPRVGERRTPPEVTQPAPRAGDRRLPPGQEKKQPEVTQPSPAQRGNVQVPRISGPGTQQPTQRGNVEVPRAPVQRAPESVFRGRQGSPIDPGAASQRGQASRREQSRPAPQVHSVPQQPRPAPQARPAPQQSRTTPQIRSVPQQPRSTREARSLPQGSRPAPQVRSAPQQSRPAPQVRSAPSGEAGTGQSQRGNQGGSKRGGQGQDQGRRK